MNNNTLMGFCSGTGAAVAILADFIQKPKSSSTGQIINVLGSNLNMPSWSTVFLLIVLGITISFIFDADNKLKAFYFGASILSLLMTFVPVNNTPLNTGTSKAKFNNGVLNIISPNSAYALTDFKPVKVKILLNSVDKKRLTDTMIIVSDENEDIVGKAAFYGGESIFYQQPGKYYITIDSNGFEVQSYSLVLKPGEDERVIPISLRPSRIPSNLQKLFRGGQY